MPNCQHYVTVSLKGVEVVAYDRASTWHERTVAGLDERLALPALDLAIPLADIYRWTPLGQATRNDETQVGHPQRRPGVGQGRGLGALRSEARENRDGQGKLLSTEEDRETLLALLLANVGADRAVRLGDPEVWRAAVAKLPR